MKQQLIVIQGPTASGKTALAVEVAKRLNTVVISADSRQFYKEMEIGTAKPLPEEMNGITHYFVDYQSVEQPVSAAQFEKEAIYLLENELSDKEYIVIAGGSGLFIDALCIGLDPIPTDETIQLELRKDAETNGIEALLEELKNADPAYYETVDKSNPPRILRSLEVFRLTGIPFTEWRKKQPSPRSFDVHRFTISHNRDKLYERINLRVDRMIESGLFEEARSLEKFRLLSPLQTVGYKECFDYFDGRISLQECTEKIKQNTRNYAKRQLTWFRRHPESVELSYSSNEIMADKIIESLNISQL